MERTTNRILIIGLVLAGLVIGIFISVNTSTILDRVFVPVARFNIAAAGDWGCDVNAVNTVSNIKSQDPEVVLALGDLSYEGDSHFSSHCPKTSS